MKKYKKYLIPIFSIAILIGFGYLILYIYEHNIAENDYVVYGTVEVPEPVYKYGFCLDSFTVFEDQIMRDQNLSDLLLNYNLDYPTIYAIVNQSKGVFNTRKIRSGNNYTMLCKRDSTEQLLVMIYEIDNIDYLVFDLRDSIRVYREKKQIISERKMASGEIQTSLYQTLVDNELNPMVAIELSEIFAWEIDFYRLQKGDKFKVIYYEDFVEGKSIAVRDIQAAYFHHFDNEYFGIYFEQDSIGDYYDEKGKSLRKAFLKSPLEYGKLTSAFTYKRFHPVQKRWKPHLGTDYAAPYGTPIRSTGAGTIVEAQYSKFNGNYVKVKHNSTYSTQYLHMSKIAKGIHRGTRVKQGQTIGYVGSTGLSTGPHVCYRFWKNGAQIDGRKEKFPASKPIKENYKIQYDSILNLRMEELNKIKYIPKIKSKAS